VTVAPQPVGVAPLVPQSDLAAMTRDVQRELDGVWRRVTENSSFIGGELVETFEERWAAYCDSTHCVGVANGTDALELILRALGIGLGDEVIVPANTFIATAEAVVLAGAVPRFVDVDPETLLVTPQTIAEGINGRTAAIVPVELYGNMPDLDGITALAAASGLALIEDSAQAHGSTWHGRRAGSFGAAGSFSFYPGKNLGAFGDAGAIVTSDERLAERIRQLANHGRPPGASHVHAVVARNSRLDALQAGVLTAKLGTLDAWNGARRAAVSTYQDVLGPNVIRPVRMVEGGRSTYHQFVVRVPHRDEVRAELRRRGVETGVHYPIPCHRQAPYTRYAPTPLEHAERAADEILSLPLFPHISDAQIERVAESLNEIVSSGRAA
jgi:dTDP-4-amino-4,6-dideoxygalactose transaminase